MILFQAAATPRTAAAAAKKPPKPTVDFRLLAAPDGFGVLTTSVAVGDVALGVADGSG